MFGRFQWRFSRKSNVNTLFETLVRNELQRKNTLYSTVESHLSFSDIKKDNGITYRFTRNTIGFDTFRLDTRIRAYCHGIGRNVSRTRRVIVVIFSRLQLRDGFAAVRNISVSHRSFYSRFIESRNIYFSVSLPVAITTDKHVSFTSQHSVRSLHMLCSSTVVVRTPHWTTLLSPFRSHVSFSLRKSTSFFSVLLLEHPGAVSPKLTRLSYVLDAIREFDISSTAQRSSPDMTSEIRFEPARSDRTQMAFSVCVSRYNRQTDYGVKSKF